MIKAGKRFLGIELGSTRIKAVLTDENHAPVASGSFDWENRLEGDYWTYSLEDAKKGLAASYRSLAEDYLNRFGEPLTELDGMGVSAMMHGYLPFDKDGGQLCGFRTWRNTTTGEAAAILTDKFGFSIPLRWSAAHLYQAILNKEEHTAEIGFLTTLAGYVHFLLTGEKVLGIGDASGMFPIGFDTLTYNEKMAGIFDGLAAEKGFRKSILDILPKALPAGEIAGTLTAEGARLLDPTGRLKPGVPLCPPEGDAGTGQVATNSVRPGTGNVSAGTSIFANIVPYRPLSKIYTEIDIAASPSGNVTAMVHCNNCTSDLDAWVSIFSEAAELFGAKLPKEALYEKLYLASLSGSPDGGGLFSCNYISGEHLTGFGEGRPLFARGPNSGFTLANFMRTHIYSALATFRIGMDILTADEGIALSSILGHGGMFKTKGAAQRLLAGAVNTPVAVMESAGEGGAWGIALLAAYSAQKEAGECLEDYLDNKVFKGQNISVIKPDAEDMRGFNEFLARYKAGLNVEKAAILHIK